MTLAAQYDNRARVPEHPALIDGWRRDAAAFRESAHFEAAVPYGQAQRNFYDLFLSATPRPGPLMLFIHGGYWRSFEPAMFSHMAAGGLSCGLTVAVAGYTLCPAVSVAGIIEELRACCRALWRRFGQRLLVVGHSAGGHLAACLAATDWALLGAPPDLIVGGLAISGICDLRPLLATPYNADLRLDAESAAAVSPLLWPVPRVLPFESWVGATESAEFLRQSRSLSAAWTGLGFAAPYVEVERANHFSVCNELANPHSPMNSRISELAAV